MLEPGERIDDHDRVCCEYYKTLLAMGAYDEEFALFGTVYLEQDKRKCYISTNRYRVYQFFKECREKQLYPTVVEPMIRRIRVHSGQKAQLEQQLKTEFAYELEKRYTKEFLMDLQQLAACPLNNQAERILGPLKEQLEGCFDEDALLLFEGAVEYAYEGKILASKTYYSYKDWLKQERDFLLDKKYPAKHLKREIAGFGYKQAGQMKYYTNALEEKALEKHLDLMSQGVKTTPIFKKKYYLASYAELPRCLEEFEQAIRERIDDNYWALIDDLYALSPEINRESFQILEDNMRDSGRGVLKTLGYYKTLWHMQKYE